MDEKTLAAYDASAEAFAREWLEQPEPVDLHALVKQYFALGPTADIGCGSGREVAWLTANGYPAIGYDASVGLIAQARKLHPRSEFVNDALPALSRIRAQTFDNVMCE